MAKQFLDESAFTIKLGGVEIDPTSGEGIEGLLKIAGWTVEKTPPDESPQQTKTASMALSFGGATIVSGSNGNLVYRWPTGAQVWGGFGNEEAEIYPVSFTGSFADASFITFTASVPSGGSADVYFRFEKNPHPDVNPAINTDSVTVSGSVEKNYSVVIPSQGDKQFRNLVMYVQTRDVNVAMRNIDITANFLGADASIGNDLIFSYEGVEKLRLPSFGSLGIGSRYSEFVYTGTSNQTAFSGTDNFGTILRYSPGKAVVFMNGVRLSANVDYTATNGTSVDFTDGVTASDIITIQSF